MPWYVIYTKPNSEKKITKYLSEKGINVFCPLYEEMRQWSDRKKKIELPLFRSYIFVNLTDYNLESQEILEIPGVIRFIWWQRKPGIVKDKEIEEIISFLHINKNNKIVIDYNINIGDSVNIKTGPLIGQSGKFISVRGKKAVLELSTLGCRLVALVSLNNIELN